MNLRTVLMGAGVFLLAVAAGAAGQRPQDKDAGIRDGQPEVVSPQGRPLYARQAGGSPKLEADLAAARKKAAEYPENPDNVIWVGRHLGYLWRMNDAVAVYSEALRAAPDYAPLYRHRGHRFISLRRFDKAIEDLERAAALIRGKPDTIEPDGMPNARNIPLTTTASNVWYHLGLANYLVGDWKGTLDAFEQCAKFNRGFDDNLVSSTYWRYLALRRLGRGDEAEMLLKPIGKDMEIIENHAYHRLLLMFKGEGSPEELMQDAESDSVDFATLGYGLGCMHLFDSAPERAAAVFERVAGTKYWPAFGCVAAEVELTRLR